MIASPHEYLADLQAAHERIAALGCHIWTPPDRSTLALALRGGQVVAIARRDDDLRVTLRDLIAQAEARLRPAGES